MTEESTNPAGNKPGTRKINPSNLAEKEAVARELESILGSTFFRASKRSKEFLSYVVRHELERNQEPLKERTIGVDLFARPAGYATGDDPVVRVQAGDVRRRLEQYYHSTPDSSPVRIELPVGSYTPELIWTSAEPQPNEMPEPAPHAQASSAPAIRKPRRLVWGYVIGSLLLAGAMFLTFAHHPSAQKSNLDRFWSPAFSSSEPILICLAKPMVYRPSVDAYHIHSRPDQFNSESERLNALPPLRPDDTLKWQDMLEYPEYGVARGDVYAAVRLSVMLEQMGKNSELRIGDDYTYADLRNSPAVLVGAFNNRWAMQITSSLHFRFAETDGKQMIQEQGLPQRDWQAKAIPHGNAKTIVDDYGLVTRLLDSKTGQFVVTVAGIGANGTQAASELVTNPQYLDAALRNVPPGWAQKNLEFVVHTTVTDSVTGPPQVVAVYVW